MNSAVGKYLIYFSRKNSEKKQQQQKSIIKAALCWTINMNVVSYPQT